MAAAKKQGTEIVLEAMQVERASFWIRGITPLIYHAMSAKAKRTLLFPQKKTAADKAQNLKHEPHEEYRSSVYRSLDPKGASLLVFPASGIKRAIASAALEVPGARKAQIGRLVWVVGQHVSVFGVPQIYATVVRSADMNRTPDIRTRAIVPEWCCCVTVEFVRPTMNATGLSRLLETAGLVIGIGDFRQEKGAGNYGQFSIVNEADVTGIISAGGRKEQEAALESPEFYDSETQELLEWFEAERISRGK